jgi:hypothetical protein
MLAKTGGNEMRKSWKVCSILCAWICVVFSFAGTSASADTVVIEATPQVTWKSGTQQSTTGGTPLTVQVAKGDTIQIQIPGGPHGFVTIDKAGNQNPAEKRNLVLACGDVPPPKDKDETVLRETGCTGAQSNFGKQFTGTLTLQVLDKFQADVNFWCVVHKKIMWGIIKLKS